MNVTASGETFEQGVYAYADALEPIVPVPVRGAIDFGGGAAASTGGNDFIGARITEILVTRRNETVSALDDTWNPNQQGANRSGQYKRTITFASGATGQERHDTRATQSVRPSRSARRRSRRRRLRRLHRRRRRRRQRRSSFTDTLQKIFAAKAASLEQEQAREPYEVVRARALARAGERRGFLAALRKRVRRSDRRRDQARLSFERVDRAQLRSGCDRARLRRRRRATQSAS